MDVVTEAGLSPLHYAVGHRKHKSLELLLQHNSYLLARTRTFSTEMGFFLPTGSTPLHVAVERSDVEAAKAILVHHASSSIRRSAVDVRWVRDSDGWTPYQIAFAKNQSAILIELLHPVTDLVASFGIQSLQDAPAEGVPKLSFMAAAALQVKLILDVKRASLVFKSQPGSLRDGDGPSATGASAVALLTSGGSAPSVTCPGREELGTSPRKLVDGRCSNDAATLCAVCFEREVDVSVGGCQHKLCAVCAEQMCTRLTDKPLACPFCRKSIGTFVSAS